MNGLGRLGLGSVLGPDRRGSEKRAGVVGRGSPLLRSSLGHDDVELALGVLRPLSLSAAKVTGHRSSFVVLSTDKYANSLASSPCTVASLHTKQTLHTQESPGLPGAGRL